MLKYNILKNAEICNRLLMTIYRVSIGYLQDKSGCRTNARKGTKKIRNHANNHLIFFK
jgi:hypothetical protein